MPPEGEAQVTAELAALSARVAALERELAQIRQSGGARLPEIAEPAPAAPPPRPPRFDAIIPNFSKNLPSAKASLEDRIGSQLFSRIGIVALLIGTTWFLKWAIDNHWIGPLGRILAGLIAGTAIVLWSERFRHKGFPAFSYSLKAIGSGALYLSLWAAFQLYHLLPAGAALGAMILVTAWNAFMAWSQNSQVLAAYALAGGLATPLLLSTGGNHEIFLFTYILAIDAATVILVRLKNWPRLLLGAFPGTVAYFIGWYFEWYSSNASHQLGTTVLFIALFFVSFAFPSLGPSTSISDERKPDRFGNSLVEVLLPLANAAFAALALYSVLVDAQHHDLLPWMAVLFAALYLVLMRVPQSRVAAAVHLSLAVVFLTIAIPLKASGRWITIGWLVEGVALLWISARLSGATQQDASVSVHRLLRRLGVAALGLGFCGLLIQPFWFYQGPQTAFLNARFATALFGIAAFAAATWIALRAWRSPDAADSEWQRIAGGSIVAVNLIALQACVREIDTIWRETAGNAEADLKRALAVSAFLMIYGASLLAVGFWRRSAFIRWQALLLLVFTIAKTFLYDMRNLSQGYRVVSFLGLGALLMAISFAYQKDWLSLREPSSSATPGIGNKFVTDSETNVEATPSTNAKLQSETDSGASR
jgi:uncharacterized membrane protein